MAIILWRVASSYARAGGGDRGRGWRGRTKSRVGQPGVRDRGPPPRKRRAASRTRAAEQDRRRRCPWAGRSAQSIVDTESVERRARSAVPGITAASAPRGTGIRRHLSTPRLRPHRLRGRGLRQGLMAPGCPGLHGRAVRAEVPTALEVSRSARGAHVWTFFSEPVGAPIGRLPPSAQSLPREVAPLVLPDMEARRPQPGPSGITQAGVSARPPSA